MGSDVERVSPEGLEPSTLGLKGRCSTTELWALGVRRNLNDLDRECKVAAAWSDHLEEFQGAVGETS
jgi:hypothetical protein